MTIKDLFLDKDLISKIDRISKTSASILIQGESGTGKEYIAHYIHKQSSFSNREPLFINLSAIPQDLLEKELFGSVKGSFTGAETESRGKLLLADNSTLVLDEISELPLQVQGKIVNFLETGFFYPIGSSNKESITCRIIAITNKNLYEMTEKGLFRKDLFYRLNTIILEIPALRDRINHLKPLSIEILNSFSPKAFFSLEAMNQILSYDWPGNIRELRNVIERAVVLSELDEISSENLLLSSDNNVNISSTTLKQAIDDFKRKYILKVLESNDWNITKSANILDIQRTYLSRLVKELNNK